jgi:PadR family transcriptional regulator, regulatory protein AphA
MSSVKEVTLTPTSHIVLGLVALAGETTPYALKQMVAGSVGHFWSIPHSQLYAEPARLAGAGFLDERRERGGRRRKHYSLTERGRRALQRWAASETEEGWELRDPGLLKLFFGADPAVLAREQLATHQRRLDEYEAMLELAPAEGGPRLTLEAGIGHEREYVRFWSRVAEGTKAGLRRAHPLKQ